MKYLYLISMLSVAFSATAQKTNTKSSGSADNSIYVTVDHKPSYKGGQKSMYKYFQTKLVYPKEAKKSNTTGIVYIEFIVSKTGKIENAMLLKGIGSGCDKAALELIKNMRDWNPGINNGKKVRVKMTLPIAFKLS